EVFAAARLFFANVAVGIGAAFGALLVGVADADGCAAGFAGVLFTFAATSHVPPPTASTPSTAPSTWKRIRRRLACSAGRASCRSRRRRAVCRRCFVVGTVVLLGRAQPVQEAAYPAATPLWRGTLGFRCLFRRWPRLAQPTGVASDPRPPYRPGRGRARSDGAGVAGGAMIKTMEVGDP